MREDTTEFIEMVNEMLNEMFHANYAILQSLARSQSVDSSSIAGGCLSERHEAIAENRSNYFNTITTSYTNCFNDNLDKFLKDEQAKVMTEWHNYYHDNKTFDECFDGFNILDKDFYDKFLQYIMLNMAVDNSQEFINLSGAYLDYLEYYRTHCAFTAFADIMDTLNNDISSSGYKTFFFERPLNENVSFITKEEISTLEKLAKQIKRTVDHNKSYFSIALFNFYILDYT